MMDKLLEAVCDTTDRSGFVPVELVAELGIVAAIDALKSPSVIRVAVLWYVGDAVWELTVEKTERALEDGTPIFVFRWEAQTEFEPGVVEGKELWQDAQLAFDDARRALG